MRTTVHPVSAGDLEVVADAVANAHVVGGDSGRALLDRLGEPAPGEPAFSSDFATTTFRTGSVRGEWVAAPGTASSGVVLYLHARRFQYDEPAGVFAGRLSAATALPVLLVDYRLAPKHPYPAALDDVLAAYQALLDQGIPAKRIVLVGHSAGATLALSALLALHESGRPLPAGAAAISPITDFTLSGDSLIANRGKDTVTDAEVRQARDAYLGGANPAAAPQSPLAGDCAGLPPLLIVCGDAELLRDDATRFAQRAAADGVEVSLAMWEGMPHGFPLLPTEAARAVLDRIAAFTAQQLTAAPPASGDRPLTIRRIGWAACEIVTQRGTRVLVDPYLAGSEGFHTGLPQSPIHAAELARADVIAVTHAGYDHRGQALQIAEAGQATVVCGTALFRAALEAGIPVQRLGPMVSGVEFHFRDVTIKALPARHESSMTVDGQFLADEPQSFLLTTADGQRIFCGGDTSLSEDLRTWGELYRPQIAILGVGGVWVGAVKVVELPPADAALATRWLGVTTVIPVHYPPNDPAPAQLAADLAAAGAAVEVAVLDFNDTWTAPPRADMALDQQLS
ncbi:alpha/beta fold hydrolase [Nocardia jiangxiensis]|uniref:alpha/beta fold hydrolase n=1 Tax=Nocardia jiangxiensis TaxID=282685 RepID=UPI0002E875B8|nr:alpha/beta fold hydrolase [Nocardia jiangxiensis]